MNCEICGYENERYIQLYPDGIYRCNKCADLVVFGFSRNHHNLWVMSNDELNELIDIWNNHEINQITIH